MPQVFEARSQIRGSAFWILLEVWDIRPSTPEAHLEAREVVRVYVDDGFKPLREQVAFRVSAFRAPVKP